MEHITTDIGSHIRQAREHRGLTIRDIANTRSISTAALNAIEHNDFARLSDRVFRRAYVRAFATEVGLGADGLTNFGDYTATYGAIGGAVVTMLWFHVSSTAILMGGRLNGVIEDAWRSVDAWPPSQSTEKATTATRQIASMSPDGS